MESVYSMAVRDLESEIESLQTNIEVLEKSLNYAATAESIRINNKIITVGGMECYLDSNTAHAISVSLMKGSNNIKGKVL